MSSAPARTASSPLPGVPALVALLITVGVLAFNQRGPMLAVAPLLATIRGDLDLSGVTAGFITTLPVLCFGLISPLAPLLARKLGLDTTLLLAESVLAGGLLVRMGQPALLLYVGTFGIGSGIAIVNVLLPAFVKREAPHRTGMLMSLYTMLLNGGAALGAALSVPVLEQTGWGWRPTLGIWLIPVAIGIAAVFPWARHARRHGSIGIPLPARGGLWTSPLAWQVTIAMGTQSLIFFGVTAWLPTMLQDAGMSESRAGAMLSLVSLAGLAGSTVTPMLTTRFRSQSWLGIATPLICLAPLLGFVIAPTTLTAVWALMLGFGLGMALSLMLMLIILRTPDAHRSSELSGMAQGVGYLFASTGPIVVGAIHDTSGGWDLPFIFIILLLVPFGVSAVLAGRDRLIAAD